MQDNSNYAGRWVARIRGKIIAQGGTPEQALHAAQNTRHKEKLEIIYMPIKFPPPPLLEKVRDALPDQDIYLVGGAVRDMILNRLSRDFDFAVPSGGISLARRVARAIELYGQVVEKDTAGIRADNSLYAMAQLYETRLNEPEKAKDLYEKIFINYSGSVFAVEARKRYRILRGDKMQ